VQIFTHAAFNKCYRGDLPGAESVLAKARRIAGGKRASPSSRIRTLFAEAFFRNAGGSFQRVLELTREALELAGATGVHVMDFMILCNGARGALNADDLPAARALLARLAAAPIAPRRWTRCFQEYFQGALALREGDLERAARCADLALEAAASAGVCYSEAASRLLKAEVLHEGSELDCAAAQLAAGEALAVENGYVQLQLNARFAAARLAFAREGEAAGVAALRSAMAVGSRSGGLVPYLCRAPALSELCAAALRHGVEVEYARALIARCALVGGAPDLKNEHWPWPVKIYTLGRFEVSLRGVPLHFSGKIQKKPLMLLKALVAFGGRAVSESRLTEALWPDSDGAMAHTSFSSTLHRLRLLLGDREALEVRDGALGLDPQRCWVDVWALERFLRVGQSAAAGEAGSTPEGLEKAIALYGGSFLPQDADAYWTIAPRERLRGQFVRVVAGDGRSLEAAGRWDEAAATYQRATEVDPLAEELHRRLMLCHERMGRRAEALAAYERCRRVLRKALGVEPSAETEALGLRLRME